MDLNINKQDISPEVLQVNSVSNVDPQPADKYWKLRKVRMKTIAEGVLQLLSSLLLLLFLDSLLNIFPNLLVKLMINTTLNI